MNSIIRMYLAGSAYELTGWRCKHCGNPVRKCSLASAQYLRVIKDRPASSKLTKWKPCCGKCKGIGSH